MPFRLLVVNPDSDALARIEQTLTAAGYLVTAASGFDEAKRRLMFAPPDLLLTDVRLGAYNGLHLVIRARGENAEIPAIVVDVRHDAVLEAEALGAGASYVTKWTDSSALLALIRKLLDAARLSPSSTTERRWPRKRATISAVVAGSDARVVDVSYGGMRLELAGIPNDRLSRLAAVDIPEVGMLPIRAVWARGASNLGVWWCGAEVAAADYGTTSAWRRLVDSLH